jgi:hypothetical protein
VVSNSKDSVFSAVVVLVVDRNLLDKNTDGRAPDGSSFGADNDGGGINLFLEA